MQRSVICKQRARRSFSSTSPSSPTTRATGQAHSPSTPAALSAPHTCTARPSTLCAWAWDDFLRANGDPHLDRLTDVDPELIFPHPDGALPDQYVGFEHYVADYPAHVRTHPLQRFTDIPHHAQGLAGLEQTRRPDFEDWLNAHGLDAVTCPGGGRHRARRHGRQRNLRRVGLAQRRMGRQRQPAVTPSRHLDCDGTDWNTGPIGMPLGLTFAGRSYDDTALLAPAAAFEAPGGDAVRRRAHPRCGPTVNDYRLGARPARSTRRRGWAARGHSRVRRPS